MKDGVFKLDQKGKPKELVLPFVYLSSLTSSTPPIEGLFSICVDEIITMDAKRVFVLARPVEQIQKLADRTRAGFNIDHNMPVFLIFNPHSYQNDWFSALELDFDYKAIAEGQNFYVMYETSTGARVFACIIINTELIEANNKKVAHQEAENRRKGIVKYLPPDYRLKLITPKPADAQLIKQFYVSEVGIRGIFGIYKSSEGWWIGLENQMNYTVPCYCLYIEDKRPNCFYLANTNAILNHFDFIRNAFLNDQVRFFSPYTMEAFKAFISDVDGEIEYTTDN